MVQQLAKQLKILPGKAAIAVEEAGRELERMRREQASKIVVPGQEGNGPAGGIIT
jgi:hypothetical protein